LAKRVLVYTNHFFPEQFKINEIVQWLSESNFEVRVVTCIPNYPEGKFYKGYGFRSIIGEQYDSNTIINRLPLTPRGSGSKILLSLNYLTYFISCFWFTIYLILFKKKYDYVFVHHTSPILIAINPIIYKIIYNSKMILWDLDIWPETLEAIGVIKSNKVLGVLKIFIKHVYSFYDKLLLSSNALIKILKDRYSGEIIFFPNWAEKVIEDNQSIKSLPFLKNERRFKIMYTGNIGYAQNFESLIPTIIKLKDEDIVWIFIGDGRFKEKFEKLIIQKALQESTLFISQKQISEIPSYIKHADVMYLSLRNEFIFNNTIPAKLQSYMALAKPVIGVVEGEGNRIIVDSGCGIVENNNNLANLSEMILNLKKLPNEELMEMGVRGKLFYENFFAQVKRKKQLIKIINNL
jgi:glycosyltransferase involved in cell wall biosynthesis